MPYLHSLQNGAENTVTGYLNVSVCGGNTANTEFEFLTGNSMAFLPQGSIPYQQYITKELPALPAYLASLGYETVATHPYYADGWDRDKVYPLLGFSESIFKDQYWGAGYVRKYVSDNSCVDKIIELYEKKEEGTPLFVFNVTMQNHGGYSDTYDNFTPDITVEGVESTPLSQYLSLVRLSDQALEKLISYTGDREIITIDDMNEICSTVTVSKIFDMIDAMGNKNRTKTLSLYYDMIEVKEPPMRILYMLSRQFNIMLGAGELAAGGMNAKEIAAKMGLAPFVVNKALGQTGKFKSSDLKNALRECIGVEEEVKNGKMEDKIGVEMILVKYAS